MQMNFVSMHSAETCVGMPWMCPVQFPSLTSLMPSCSLHLNAWLRRNAGDQKL